MTLEGYQSVWYVMFFKHFLAENSFYFCKDFICLFERDRDSRREHEWRGEVEADSPMSREPDTGLDPRPLES